MVEDGLIETTEHMVWASQMFNSYYLLGHGLDSVVNLCSDVYTVVNLSYLVAMLSSSTFPKAY